MLSFNRGSHHILKSESNPGLRNSSCRADVVTHLSIHLSVTAVIGMDLE